MPNLFKILLICLCFFSKMTETRASDGQKNGAQEIRVLIDVSGSMKQNDPKNLRIPAIKLLINLLPDGTKAGFWMFAEHPKVIISPQIVSKPWKQQVLNEIKKIHSRGQLTDIEKALQAATQDWNKIKNIQNRHLILLTDGMVDVSRDFMESADSRERIIDSIIPKLQQQGIKIHTIALSENADKGLMKRLALATGGWSEIIDSAEQLQRVFLKLFNKAVPLDTLPISGNKFMIDSRIKEFSVLIFRRSGAADTRIITPDEQELSQINTPDNVNWLHEKNYDLVTVQKPEPGQWRIVAETDPDNQIMIVTDLKLQMNDIPNSVGKDEALDIEVFLTDRDQLITRQNFLKMLDIKLQQKMVNGQTRKWPLMPNQKKPGFFSHRITETLISGKHELIIKVDGKTFKREIKRSIEVIDSPIRVITKVDKKNRKVTLQLIPDKNLLDTSFMSVQAFITEPPKQERTVDLQEKQGQWLLELNGPKHGKRLLVNFSVTVKTRKGNPVMPDIKPIFINSSLFEDNSKKLNDPQVKPDTPVEDKVKTEIESGDDEDSESKDVDQEATDWLMISLMVAGGNFILIVFGFLIYRWQKKTTLKQQEQLLERLE